jgi:hypothetical protein
LLVRERLRIRDQVAQNIADFTLTSHGLEPSEDEQEEEDLSQTHPDARRLTIASTRKDVTLSEVLEMLSERESSLDTVRFVESFDLADGLIRK